MARYVITKTGKEITEQELRSKLGAICQNPPPVISTSDGGLTVVDLSHEDAKKLITQGFNVMLAPQQG
jgi:hypothetical protein